MIIQNTVRAGINSLVSLSMLIIIKLDIYISLFLLVADCIILDNIPLWRIDRNDKVCYQEKKEWNIVQFMLL